MSTQQQSVLISGASFAGLATAFWMIRQGYRVTVVEVAASLRKGGTPVDIREGVIEVVRRMGLLERIAQKSLQDRPMQFLDASGTPVARMGPRGGDDPDSAEYEIERDDLLDLLFDEVKGHAEFMFSSSIASLEQGADAVAVTFASGEQRHFSLVFGCDGTHSAVRRMCFGEESSYLYFMQNYFALSIVNRLLLEENSSQMFNAPGRTVMLNTYNGKTDIAFCFASETQIDYDRRDRTQQRQMIRQHFQDGAWRIPELLDCMDRCDNFYFDQLCQIRMDTWTTGRVALVGDAGYCPSPAAGMGGSMAILGAAALADAMQKYPGDHVRAFAEYNRNFGPVAQQIQLGAIEFGMAMAMPKTEEDIQRRNEQFNVPALAHG